MKKSYRVKRNTDFQAIFEQGKSKANRKFVVYYLEKDQPHFRAGLSVSKKLGNAVVRNRTKRKIRHCLQEFSAHLAQNVDMVIIARKGVEDLDYQDVQNNLRHVLKLANIYQEGFTSEQKD
ncbi:ribonuclease P protein component [Streptococcus caprae]|uniref:Ribonuclease P protein component n=1 Tax=Streptococcus caprae TaxID=1640501 RepID=A0ABV8CTC9_9STRE